MVFFCMEYSVQLDVPQGGACKTGRRGRGDVVQARLARLAIKQS